jgi:hypothetical protein
VRLGSSDSGQCPIAGRCEQGIETLDSINTMEQVNELVS